MKIVGTEVKKCVQEGLTAAVRGGRDLHVEL